MSDDDLALVDDPRVTEFRRQLRAVETWIEHRADRNDRKALYTEAVAIVARYQALSISSHFSLILHALLMMVMEDVKVDPTCPEKSTDDRRMLYAFGFLMDVFGETMLPGFLPDWLAGDFYSRAVGDPPFIGEDIPPSRGYGKRPGMLAELKKQTIRLAHYNAGRNGKSWEAEHALVFPGLSEGARRGWNRLVTSEVRQACRRVGARVRAGVALTDADERIRAEATRKASDELFRIVHSLR